MMDEKLGFASDAVESTAYSQQTERCLSDVSSYLIEIKQYDIKDVSFSQDLQKDTLRCANVLGRISEIKTIPLLASASPQEKSEFYRSIRANDDKVAVAEGKAMYLVRSVTGLDPVNVGSFGLKLNLTSSDIDLGIGVADPKDFESTCTALMDAGFKYKQARDTRYLDDNHTTKRFVFSKYLDDVEIDVSVYHTADLNLLSEGGYKCRTGMSDADRATHTWDKFQLKQSNTTDEYNVYKLEPYIRYKPGFKWVSIN